MKAPVLGTIGRQFWDETTSTFGLSATELALLEQVCHRMDALAAYDVDVLNRGYLVTSDKGVVSVNPSAVEARQQSQVLHRMLSALAIPDDAGETLSSARAASARSTATTRWGKSDPVRKPAAG